MANWTNGGLNLVASAVQTPGAQVAVTYVAIGTGAGTMAAAITSGVAITSLTLDANVPASLASGQQLTVTDGVNSETVTTSASVTGGATNVIPIASWTPAHSYAAHTTGVTPVQVAADLTLYNETQRVAANAGVAGASAGESLNAGYFDGTQPTAVYLQVGYFGGSTATTTLGSGTLMMEDTQYWSHTLNADSNQYQVDNTI